MKPRQIAASVVILGLAGAIYAVSRPLKRSGQTWNCQSNLKQIGLGMMQYARDYDEQFPRAANWTQALRPYTVGHNNPGDNSIFEPLFRCPMTNGYYALNIYYAQLSASQDKSPRVSPLVFDIANGRLNQSDNGKGWPIPPIHKTLQTTDNNVLFADGHVELRGNKPSFRKFAPLPKPTATPKPRAKVRKKIIGSK